MAILIRKGIYFFFDIDILVYFLINNSLSSYAITFVYFIANFFTGLSIGEIFNSLGIKYIKENKSFLGLPLGLELPKDKLLLDDRGEISKTKIKAILPSNSLNQDNTQVEGSSTIKNIDNLLKTHQKSFKDFEQLVIKSKHFPQGDLNNRFYIYKELIDNTIELRTKFIKDQLSLEVSAKTVLIVKQELTALSKEHEKYVAELNNISTYDPNSKKKTFDALNRYKNAQNKSLNYLTQLTRQDLKGLDDKSKSESLLKTLNQFDNAANISQNQLKKVQKELAQSIDQLNKE